MKEPNIVDPASLAFTPACAEEPLPLVVFPWSGFDTADCSASLRACADRYLPRFGTILFRGFNAHGPRALRRFARSFWTRVGGGPIDIWGTPSGIGRLWIGCSNQVGSRECPIADARELYQGLSNTLRTRLVRYGLRFSRDFHSSAAWQRAFLTDQKERVEAWCQNHGVAFQWTTAGALNIHCTIGNHNASHAAGGSVWSGAGPLIRLAYRQVQSRRYSESLFQRMSNEPDVCFGDGSIIDVGALAEIVESFESCAFQHEWETGDVLLLDRSLTCGPTLQAADPHLHYVQDWRGPQLTRDPAR